MDQEHADTEKSQLNSSKIRGVSDLLLILRDRWLISLCLALPIALAFAYKELQVPEYFRSTSSFRLIPPPAIINLQKVDQQEQQFQLLVAKHRDGLNSQELKAQVTTKIENSPDLKAEMLRPFVESAIPISVGATVSYSISVSDESRPRFTITSNARSAKSAMIIAREVQSEYEILHKSNSSLKVESALKTLERLLEREVQKEKNIKDKISAYKVTEKVPFLEDDMKDIAAKKSQYQSEITRCRIEKLRIDSIKSQVNEINEKIKAKINNSIEEKYNLFGEFFKINEVNQFGDNAFLRKSLQDLYIQRKNYEEVGTGYLENHPKMIANARQIKETQKQILIEIKQAIASLDEREFQLNALERNFLGAMKEVQDEAENASKIDDTLKNYERELQIVQASSAQMQKRLNDVTIEQAFPQEQDNPLQKEQFASLPSYPYTPDRDAIYKKAATIFLGIFIVFPFLLEFVDNRIKSPWDVQVFLGRDLISGIPKISNIDEHERPLIVGNDLDDGLAESFRSMFSKIQINSFVDYPKVILVTSAIPSEGKSLISTNLAYTCANHGKNTVLIDFDLRRPGLHKFAGLDNNDGLIPIINNMQENPNYLEENFDKKLNPIHPNLRMLTSGGKTRSVTELIEKSHFHDLLNKIKSSADIIIVDSPPVGLFPDAMALSKVVDDIIFVTRYGKVARRAAKGLVSNLEESGSNILGIVLNDLPGKKSTGYYYSGYYGYGYGYYRYKYYNKYYGKEENGKA